MAASKPEPLRGASVVPSFRGTYLERFLHLIDGIDRLTSQRQRAAVMEELEWCNSRTSDTLDHDKYVATLMVLRDLLRQGWQIQFRHKSIFLVRPDYSQGSVVQLDPATVKDQIRSAMQDERISKLCIPATRRFIEVMESGTPKRKSVTDLIGDGPQLAKSLLTLPETASAEQIRTVVSPYIQLVTGDERDAYTGQRLIDIWRYFRYLWAIPYLSTPGRNLFYLIRDAAQPCHPVMGIAALGNSIVQLAERDKSIGWSTEGLALRLERKSKPVRQSESRSITAEPIQYLESQDSFQARVAVEAVSIAACLLRSVDVELNTISLRNLATKKELEMPTLAIVERLSKMAAASEHERREELRESELSGNRPARTEAAQEWAKDSEQPLYRRKRAQALADLLFARMQFAKAQLSEMPLEALKALMSSEPGRKAVRTALYANKKTKIGSNMMDLIVCGAIPPYGNLLGGKLVAMLMASPQVVRDYIVRYSDQPSEITSRLAGRAVVRNADLVFLGTTSLYHVGSSQYERIKIPTPQGGATSYERLGHTEGYGSTALSGETAALLRAIVVRAEGMRRVNNRFGEGVSPRMRQIRDGLDALGMPPDVILRHSCPRIIYGVQLASNALQFLRGESSEPHYYFDPTDPGQGTTDIANFWLHRWMHPRSRRTETLSKLLQFAKSSILLSSELKRVSDYLPNGELLHANQH